MILDAFSLEGRVAIVTGARTGLGQGMAFGLAEAGADVVGIDLSNLAETEKGVEKRGRKFLGIEADLSNIKALDDILHRTAISKQARSPIMPAAPTVGWRPACFMIAGLNRFERDLTKELNQHGFFQKIVESLHRATVRRQQHLLDRRGMLALSRNHSGESQFVQRSQRRFRR